MLLLLKHQHVAPLRELRISCGVLPAMWRRSWVHGLLMLAIGLSNFFRRSMASYAAAGTRYAVELLPPPEGPVLRVAERNAQASARPAYRVLQEPAGAPFDGLQVRAQEQYRKMRGCCLQGTTGCKML